MKTNLPSVPPSRSKIFGEIPPGTKVIYKGINPFLVPDDSSGEKKSQKSQLSVTEINKRDKLLDLYCRLIKLDAEVAAVKEEILQLTDET